MNKPKVKSWLHLAGLVICLAAAVYVSLRQGLSLTERIGAIAVLFAALKTAMGQVLAQVDKAIDDLPEEPRLPPPLPNTPVICLLALGSLLIAGQARAASPEFGGCIRDGAICFGPSATVTVGQFNFATSKFSGGIVPGVGYGATYAPNEWYATGLAGYLAFTVGKGEPNEAIPSLMLSFANYVRVGAGVSITETAGPVETQWRLLFGLGSDFGGSPKYLRSQGAR